MGKQKTFIAKAGVLSIASRRDIRGAIFSAARAGLYGDIVILLQTQRLSGYQWRVYLARQRKPGPAAGERKTTK